MTNVQRLQILIGRCEQARDSANDPRFKALWQSHANQLRFRQQLIETMH